jgi:flagellar basal body rod protein FlgC
MDSASLAGSIAASGLLVSGSQIAVAATNIANAESTGQTVATGPFGSSAIAAVPTGTQPDNSASQVFQALNIVSVAQPGGGVDTAIAPPTKSADGGSASQAGAGQGGIDLAQQLVSTASAQQAFEANVATLKASELFTQAIVNVVA